MKIPLWDRLRARLVDECRDWWRWWSVRLNAIGLAIMGWLAFDPVSLLYVWNLLPRDVRNLLPDLPVTAIGAALFALALIARLVRQPKIEGKRDAR